MNERTSIKQQKTITPPLSLVRNGVLQRKCACGRSTTANGNCAECDRKSTLLQRRSVNRTCPEVAPPIVHEVLRSQGRSLEPQHQAFMEAHFRHNFSQMPAHASQSDSFQPTFLEINQKKDVFELEAENSAKQIGKAPNTEAENSRSEGIGFSNVRIHTDARANESARAVNALAYTVGKHIVFGNGQYLPETDSGKMLLAHELTHVIQQTAGLQALSVYRQLSPDDCSFASNCETPDKLGVGPANAWNLTLAVDREEENVITALGSSDVGHTWVKFSDNSGTEYSYGFWPQTGFDSKKPFRTVKGCVHHPDTSHEPPKATEYLEKKYSLTQEKYTQGLMHAQNVCKAVPNYNLFTFNCTSFAIDTVKAAELSPPSSTTLAIHNPNALATGIEKDRSEGHPLLGAVLGGLSGAAIGAGLGSLLGVGGAIGFGLLGGLAGLIGGALLGDIL